MAILESDYKKLVLSDIYKYILDKYPYFKDKVICKTISGKIKIAK